MDLTYPAEAQAFRREVRAFLAAQLPPGWTGVTGLMSFLASDTCWQFQQT